MYAGMTRRALTHSMALYSFPVASTSKHVRRSALPVLKLATGTDKNSTDGKRLREVFHLALAQIGYALEAVDLPPMRAAASLQHGEVDGEMLRSDEYISSRPFCIKVDFMLSVASVGIYGRAQQFGKAPVDAAIAASSGVVYRRGVVACESRLAMLVPSSRTFAVATTRSGAAMVIAGRVDHLCELDATVAQWRLGVDESARRALVRVGSLVPRLPLFPCLHRRHESLSVTLAAALRSLEANGVLQGLVPKHSNK